MGVVVVVNKLRQYRKKRVVWSGGLVVVVVSQVACFLDTNVWVSVSNARLLSLF